MLLLLLLLLLLTEEGCIAEGSVGSTSLLGSRRNVILGEGVGAGESSRWLMVVGGVPGGGKRDRERMQRRAWAAGFLEREKEEEEG